MTLCHSRLEGQVLTYDLDPVYGQEAGNLNCEIQAVFLLFVHYLYIFFFQNIYKQAQAKKNILNKILN